MRATLLLDSKRIHADGSMMHMRIWRVPQPVPPSRHDFKYSLVYVRDGKRLVGFDNERGKGDHLHLAEQEFPYTFTSLRQLVADFKRVVEEWSVP